MMTEDASNDSTSLQESKYEQRKRFLQMILLTKGKEIKLSMHQNTSIIADFVTMDGNGDTIAVSSLKTPIGIQKTALIRTSDVISFGNT